MGNTAVMFKRNWADAVNGMTYPASGATTHYIADLTPGATYAITGAGAPASVTADKAGVVTFSASGTGNITLGTQGAPALTGITVTPATGSIAAGGTQSYAAQCNYADNSNADCTGTVSWSSSDPAVATISSGGLATGGAAGTATIQAILRSIWVRGPDGNGHGWSDTDGNHGHAGHGDGFCGRGTAVCGSVQLFERHQRGLHGNGDVVEQQYGGGDGQRGGCGDGCGARDGDDSCGFRKRERQWSSHGYGRDGDGNCSHSGHGDGGGGRGSAVFGSMHIFRWQPCGLHGNGDVVER